MQYSMPSAPTLLDLNGDGLIDQIYIADVGGQIFRFDLNSRAANARDLAAGGVIANLANNATSGNRTFFYLPDISLINDYEGNPFLAVSIGSGNRVNPLNTDVNDRFFVIKQPVKSQADIGYGIKDGASYRPITAERDLSDTTENRVVEGGLFEQGLVKQQLQDKAGWFIRMEDVGEKILARAITINNQVLFTSYLPEANINCGAAAGSARAYVLNILDGSPAYVDDDGNQTKTHVISKSTDQALPQN